MCKENMNPGIMTLIKTNPWSVLSNTASAYLRAYGIPIVCVTFAMCNFSCINCLIKVYQHNCALISFDMK